MSENFDNKIKELIPFFSKVYYFNKLHTVREYPAKRPTGLRKKTVEKGDLIDLGAEEYSLLWLIETLSISDYKRTVEIENPYDKTVIKIDCCEQDFLKKTYFWRKPVINNEEQANYFESRFRYLLDTLKTVDLVSSLPDNDQNKNKSLEYITRQGQICLEDLRKERFLELKTILRLSGVNLKQLNTILEKFQILSDEAMKTIFEEISIDRNKNN